MFDYSLKYKIVFSETNCFNWKLIQISNLKLKVSNRQTSKCQNGHSYEAFLPCLSLIKLEKYNYGKWSQLLNKVIYFIYFLWEEQCILHMISTDDTALLTVLLAKHITSCDNVFLKGYFLLATYGVFRPI